MVHNCYVLTAENSKHVLKTDPEKRRDWYFNLGKALVGKLAPHAPLLPVFGPEKRPHDDNNNSSPAPPPKKKKVRSLFSF